jgi:adenylate kinase
MHIILFGPPGVGKGTQAQKLSDEYEVPQVSTGEMLRKAISEGSTLGNEARKFMDKGELVPDNLVLRIVEQRILQEDCRNGFILDGFPRTIPQAEKLSQLIKKHNFPKFKCIEISVPDEKIIERLTSRGRQDDHIATIKKRLSVYQNQTYPVKEYYKNINRFFKVDGDQSIDVVYKNLKEVVDL